MTDTKVFSHKLFVKSFRTNYLLKIESPINTVYSLFMEIQSCGIDQNDCNVTFLCLKRYLQSLLKLTTDWLSAPFFVSKHQKNLRMSASAVEQLRVDIFLSYIHQNFKTFADHLLLTAFDTVTVSFEKHQIMENRTSCLELHFWFS